jgi:Na+/H+ antiporter NhaD/arsenite permease-like protein
MTGRDQNNSLGMLVRGVCLIVLTALVAVSARWAQFDDRQVLSSSIFIMIILATLFFWKFRLAIAFVGIAMLLGFKALTLQSFIESSELDIILFLVGMMVTVGVLKELGLFTWIIQMVLGMEKMTGPIFVTIIVFLSAFLACAVDEVTSIVFVGALIFQVCDTLKLRPVPFLMIAVMATNIGSSGTMLGNPVGILIGHKALFGFGDFLIWAFPIMLLSLFITLAILLLWYKKDIAMLTESLNERRAERLGLGPLVQVPYKRGLAILIAMLTLIASHRPLENLLGVEHNTVLIVAPLLIAGLLMIWRHERARHYIETEVEWWTLMFFMMLFVVAGTLEHTGVTDRVAGVFTSYFGSNPTVLTPVVIFVSALGSAFVDNVVFVAAFIPVVKSLNSNPLWWSLLLGACFGGNITMIGSTANIVALGMLEKKYRTQISFGEWLKVGAVIGLVTCLVAWGSLLVLSPYMPERSELVVQQKVAPAETH